MPFCQGLEGVSNPLANMCYLQKLLISSEEIVRGFTITFDTRWQIYQRVANTLLPPVTNLPGGCQQPMAHLQEGCLNSQLHIKGQPLCNTSEENRIQSYKKNKK
jgi:hypothetical protein